MAYFTSRLFLRCVAVFRAWICFIRVFSWLRVAFFCSNTIFCPAMALSSVCLRSSLSCQMADRVLTSSRSICFCFSHCALNNSSRQRFF